MEEQPSVSPSESAATPVATSQQSVPTNRTGMYMKLVSAVVAAAGLLLLGYFFVLPFVYKSASTSKVYHVGILNALDLFAPAIDGFKQKMTELGYVEGENITYDLQKGAAPVGNQAIIQKFVDDKADLIVAFPTEASLEAKEVTRGTNVPVVGIAFGLEGSGLVNSVQVPGGNVTGVRFPIPEAALKRLEILHALAPKVSKVLVPYLKDYPTVAPGLEAIEPAAAAIGITLIKAPFSTPDEVVAYFAAHEKDVGFDAILTIPEPLANAPAFRDPILAFAEKHRMPVAGVAVSDSEKGSAFNVIPSAVAMGQLAAPFADKIFKGASAGALPVATPELVFTINLKALQRLGIDARDEIISTADQIIH